MSEVQIDIDDLPRLSPWPARLLGIEPWEQKRKTPEEITREFEREKWGPLLAKVRESEHEVSIEDVDNWLLKDLPPSLCSIQGKLKLLSAIEARRQYLDLVEQLLCSYLPASALVELGAGYGSVIIALAKKLPLNGSHIIAAEYADSGVELIGRLGKTAGLEIQVGRCDFLSPSITDVVIPENAIIFTSFATMYAPKLPSDFVKRLCAYRPRVIVHIEPCYEHCTAISLLGLMRRRYIEVNDYNQNLATLLHDHQRRGLIRLLDERPSVFGQNPLLTASILAWASNQ